MALTDFLIYGFRAMFGRMRSSPRTSDRASNISNVLDSELAYSAFFLAIIHCPWNCHECSRFSKDLRVCPSGFLFLQYCVLQDHVPTDERCGRTRKYKTQWFCISCIYIRKVYKVCFQYFTCIRCLGSKTLSACLRWATRHVTKTVFRFNGR